MPNEDGTLTEEELERLSPSDRAHYEIRGRLGDGLSTEDTEGTKVAIRAAFDTKVDADPDDSSTKKTRSPEPGEGVATVEGSGEDTTATGKGSKKSEKREAESKKSESRKAKKESKDE